MNTTEFRNWLINQNNTSYGVTYYNAKTQYTYFNLYYEKNSLYIIKRLDEELVEEPLISSYMSVILLLLLWILIPLIFILI